MSVTARISAAVAAFALLFIVLLGAAAGAVAGLVTSPVNSVWNTLFGGSDINTVMSPAAAEAIPAAYLKLYMDAAATCPGLPWEVLAGIGEVASDHGRDRRPATPVGAVGPLGLLQSAFADYAEPVPPGGADPPTPADPVDAAYAAARMLCAHGAADLAKDRSALRALSGSDAYAAKVMATAASYQPIVAAQTRAAPGTATAAPSAAAARAIAFAESQIGVPYVWGGETPGIAFDCSGLVQASYAAAGVRMPRVATDQYYATRPLCPGEQPMPGDLVFYGTAAYLDHVGIYLGDGQILDAPHPGAPVRIEPMHWPGDQLFGFTRPTG